jgi:nucleotide-binding universal stress UspA family protein
VPGPETVVVGYDGGEHSEHALELAIDEVKVHGVTLVVVVAEELPPGAYAAPAGFDSYVTPATDTELSGLAIDLENPLPGIKEKLDRAQTRVDEAGISAECVWRVGDPAQVIVDIAAEKGASRIIIGAHQYGFLGRLFGEDVDAEVQRIAGCDVVVVD